MSVHQVPSGHTFERNANGHAYIQMDPQDEHDWWTIDQRCFILVDGANLSCPMVGGGSCGITFQDALWLSAELGMKIYDIESDTQYVVGLRETILGIPE